MKYPADDCENNISSVNHARVVLEKGLPHFEKLLDIWSSWFNGITSDSKMFKLVSDIFIVSYARMAQRNGTLNKKPRCYHNETHIDDLIFRLIAVSKSNNTIPDYGWSMLSIFMCCHDLRQSEVNDVLDVVGANEQASYEELLRLIALLDTEKLIRQEHKELLKIMIHGSTFGEGEDSFGNVYKGNLVSYLLQRVGYFENLDKEIAYLACDIDTANVSAHLKDYAKSSINVYNEIQSLSQNAISAQAFFGVQQETYFFELQKFNSQLGRSVFQNQKKINAPFIKDISQTIKQLNPDTSNEEVLICYQNLVAAKLKQL